VVRSIMLPFDMTRAENIPAGFSAKRQIAQTASIAAALLAVAAALAWGAPARDWLVVPAFWVFANFFEWTVHRFPMHRALVPRIMYRNHAGIHHGSFTADTMEIAEPRELSLVMMPWYTIVMLLVAASPVAVLAGLVGGRHLVGIFYIAALTYFVFYEAVHALYHLPTTTLARLRILAPGGRGIFARMRAHHAHHHQPRRMAHVNFNVTVPLADLVLGTRESAGNEAATTAPAAGAPSAPTSTTAT